jgi:cell division protein ZapA (FtsZ GTPase activity inhibitor)
MGKVSLKVVVAGRTYPLTLNEEEKDKVLKAADDINKAIKTLQDSYAVKDMQDLLAMTALQLATKPKQEGNTNVSSKPDYSSIENELDNLSKELDNLD